MTTAEQLIEALRTEKALDLAHGKQFHADQPRAAWSASQILDAGVLREVLAGTDTQPGARGLWIRGAWFDEPIDLAHLNVPYPLHFFDCSLAGFCGDNATFSELSFNRCSIRAAEPVDGELLPAISMKDSELRGNFTLSASTLDRPGGVGISINGTRIGGNLFINHGTVIHGGVKAIGTRVHGQAQLTSVTLASSAGNALYADRIIVGGGLSLGSGFVADGTVRICGASIEGQFLITDAMINNSRGVALALDGTTISGGLMVEGLLADGQLRIVGANLSGQAAFDSTVVTNYRDVAMFFDGATVNGHLLIRKGCKIAGAVHAMGLTVNGQAIFKGASIDSISGGPTGAGTAESPPAPHALVLDGASITHGLFASGITVCGGMHAIGATVTGILDLSGASITKPEDPTKTPALVLGNLHVAGDIYVGGGLHTEGGMSIDGATVSGKVNFGGCRVGGSLNLGRSKIGELNLVKSQAEHVELDFAEIELLKTDETPPELASALGWKIHNLQGPMRTEWKRMDKWLNTSQKRKPTQPWVAIADVYERNGDPDGARRLRYAASNVATSQSPAATKVTRWTYRVLAGNGYYPLRSAVWLLIVLAVSWALIATHRGEIISTRQSISAATFTDAHPSASAPVTAQLSCTAGVGGPCLNSFTFALNHVIAPAASPNPDWVIRSTSLTISLAILRMLSWVFTAVLLAAVTGILKRT